MASGTLIVAAAKSLPGGSNLVIGAGGTFIFDPTIAGSNIAVVGQATGASAAAGADRTAEPAASRAHPNLKASGDTSMGSTAAI